MVSCCRGPPVLRSDRPTHSDLWYRGEKCCSLDISSTLFCVSPRDGCVWTFPWLSSVWNTLVCNHLESHYTVTQQSFCCCHCWAPQMIKIYFCNHVTHWMCLSQTKLQRKCMLVSKGSSGQTSSFAVLMLRSGLLSVFCSSGAASLIWENNPDDIIMMSYESMGRLLKLWNIMPDQGKRVTFRIRRC